jgi:hypothetical protein
MIFYVYRKVRESFYLAEITAEIHVVDTLKLKMLIAINIVDTEKIFINFRIRTFFINIISEFSTNIRAIRENIKIIKIVINSRKEEIVPPNKIKEIPIRIKKKLNDNRDFLFLSEYPNAIYYIVNSKFLFIRIRNDGEDPIRISKEWLELIKKFMKTEYYYVDPESHDFAVLRNINSEFHFRPPMAEKHDILIIYIINIYRKNTPMRTALIRNSQIKKQKQRNENANKRSRGRLKGAKNARNA